MSISHLFLHTSGYSGQKFLQTRRATVRRWKKGWQRLFPTYSRIVPEIRANFFSEDRNAAALLGWRGRLRESTERTECDREVCGCDMREAVSLAKRARSKGATRVYSTSFRVLPEASA